MEVTYQIDTGYPSRIMTTLRRRAAQLARTSTSFKIGITNDPERRSAEYGSAYDEMVVLYQTRSDDYVRRVEADLVAQTWTTADNFVGGGGGSRGNPPYYLYLVRTR